MCLILKRGIMMEEEKKQRIYKTIMLIVLVAVITFICTTVFLYNKLGSSTDSQYIMVTGSQETDTLRGKLNSFKKLIDKIYMGDVDEAKLEEGAIKGYIEALGDEYSEYYTKEEMQEVETATYGSFSGIGVYLTQYADTNEIIVLATIEDSPAEKAEIMPEDVITKVNGVSCEDKPLEVVTAEIKGQENTTVDIEVLRNGETKKFTIERKKIKINHIKAEIKEGNIGYINIATFDQGCANEFKQKVSQLQEQGAKSLIIDLRNNGGGIVDEAIEIADMIVDKDATTLITIDKNKNEEVKKSSIAPTINMPITLLVNGNTASASEILAGILKDNNKAKIIGTTTYGKGVIQQLMTLKDGTGIKLTTNEYLTPNRNKINKIGIKPDEEINLPDDAKNTYIVTEEQDTQLQRAMQYLRELNL